MQYVIDKIKQQIIELVVESVNQKIDSAQLEVTIPPESEMGDFAVPCFYLTKLLRRSPNQIAGELAKKIKPGRIIKSVQNIGPYLNFFIASDVISEQVIKEIAKKKNDYGRLKFAKEKIMIEYSQPNTHKEFHVGHSRNAILGSSLVRLYEFVGYKVIPVNYIGDVGAHVAKCLWALEKFHQKDKTPKNKGKYLGQIYAEAAKKTEASPKYKKEADKVLQELEKGNRKWTSLWKKTRQWSLDEFNNIYKILGCKFDHFFYESEVEKPGKKIVADLLKKNIAQESDGAIIIDLEKYNLKNFLLLKSDGSSLYSTKDLALAEQKFKKFKIDKSIIVIDTRQGFYFQQLFKTLEIIGFKKEMIYVLYEFVTLKDGAMASRQGNVVLFEDFYQQIVDSAKIETQKRHQDWPVKKIVNTSEKIALSAIKFSFLKVGNSNIITFDINEALSFDGFSGPYLQYMISRINSVLKKAKSKGDTSADFSRLNTEIEKELILKLAAFPEIITEAVKLYQPSELARYLFELAKLFSSFYQKVPILNSDEETKKARLALIDAIRQTLTNGLELIGIETLDQM